jgi:hypothetical protein
MEPYGKKMGTQFLSIATHFSKLTAHRKKMTRQFLSMTSPFVAMRPSYQKRAGQFVPLAGQLYPARLPLLLIPSRNIPGRTKTLALTLQTQKGFRLAARTLFLFIRFIGQLR